MSTDPRQVNLTGNADEDDAQIQVAIAEDRDWAEKHLTLTRPEALTVVPDRVYLECGHQMGGPAGIGPRTCATCLAWLLDHPDYLMVRAVEEQQTAARRAAASDTAGRRSNRPPALAIVALVTVLALFVIGAGMTAIVAVLTALMWLVETTLGVPAGAAEGIVSVGGIVAIWYLARSMPGFRSRSGR